MNDATHFARHVSDKVEEEVLDDVFTLDLDFRRWWAVLPEIIALVCTGAIPVLVTMIVIARYTNWFRVVWANDVVSVLFMWVVFLGGAIGVKYEAHVRMASIASRLLRLRAIGRAWDSLVRLSPIGLGAILLVLGWRVVGLHMTRQLVWLQIPLGYFSVVIPVSGALMIAYTVANISRNRRRDEAGASG